MLQRGFNMLQAAASWPWTPEVSGGVLLLGLLWGALMVRARMQAAKRISRRLHLEEAEGRPSFRDR